MPRGPGAPAEPAEIPAHQQLELEQLLHSSPSVLILQPNALCSVAAVDDPSSVLHKQLQVVAAKNLAKGTLMPWSVPHWRRVGKLMLGAGWASSCWIKATNLISMSLSCAGGGVCLLCAQTCVALSRTSTTLPDPIVQPATRAPACRSSIVGLWQWQIGLAGLYSSCK